MNQEAFDNHNKVKLALEEALNQSAAKVVELEMVIVGHVKKEQQLTEQLSNLHDEISVKQSEINQMAATISALNDNEKSLKNEIETLTKSNGDTKAELDNLIEKCTNLEKLVEEKDHQIQSDKSEHEQKVAELTLKETNLHDQIVQLSKTYVDTEKRIEILEKEKSDCLRDMDEIRSTLEKERSNNERKCEQIQNDLNATVKALEKKAQENDSVQLELSTVQTELEQSVNALNDIRTEIDNIAKAKLVLEETLNEANDKIANLKVVSEKVFS